MRGKRGYGASAIAEKVNTSILSSPNDHKLSATSLQRAKDYQQSRSELAELGFNTDILDLQPKVAVNQSIHADKEAVIEALMKKGGG